MKSIKAVSTKLIAGIVISLLFVPSIVTPVLAGENNVVYNMIEENHICDADICVEQAEIIKPNYITKSVTSTSTFNSCKQKIKNEIANGAMTINISAYNLTDEEAHMALIQVLNENPSFFHISYVANYSRNSSDKIINIYLKRVFSEEERPTIEREITTALSHVDSSMTDFQKALVLHDYLVQNVSFQKDANDRIFDIYGTLVNHIAVCNGYATTYKVLMDRLSIPCRYIYGDSGAHAWNQIQIDGVWYNVDCSWDDVSDTERSGWVQHKYFLASDSKMTANSHHDWISTINCTNTDYDSCWFSNVKSEIVVYSGSFYYIQGDSGYYTIYKRTGNNVSAIKSSLTNRIYKDGYTYRCMCYLCGVGDKLYYNADGKIYEYDLASGSEFKIFDPYSTGIVEEFLMLDDGICRIKYAGMESGTYNTYRILPAPGFAGWYKLQTNWLYFNAAGKRVTGWQNISGDWYYFNASGHMQTGWKEISGNWYYLASSGKMLTGWQKIGGIWYYFASSGNMLTGWQKISGDWYYFNASGHMQTGWKEISGNWYYLAISGKMLTGWQEIDGEWYYLASSGKMINDGWRQIGGQWYYFRSSGTMVRGWLKLDGNWYYFRPNGTMQTLWRMIDGEYYYFYENSGKMATDTWIGELHINSSGKCDNCMK